MESIDTTFTLEMYEGLAEEAAEKLRKGMLVSPFPIAHISSVSHPLTLSLPHYRSTWEGMSAPTPSLTTNKSPACTLSSRRRRLVG